jgi:hypothetical protein
MSDSPLDSEELNLRLNAERVRTRLEAAAVNLVGNHCVRVMLHTLLDETASSISRMLWLCAESQHSLATYAITRQHCRYHHEAIPLYDCIDGSETNTPISTYTHGKRLNKIIPTSFAATTVNP